MRYAIAALIFAAGCAAGAWWVENNIINMFRADEYR